MTWSTHATIPAGEQFDEASVGIDTLPENYQDDARAAVGLVPALDGADDVVRQVSLSGYRSETTNSISVSVTKRPNAAGSGG